MRVFDDYDSAKAAEVGSKRVYRVTDGDHTVYVVAVSPTAAIGGAAHVFGLRAELVEPRYYLRAAGMTIEELVKALGPEQRRNLLDRLEGRK